MTGIKIKDMNPAETLRRGVIQILSFPTLRLRASAGVFNQQSKISA
jgi:hypothetical protein